MDKSAQTRKLRIIDLKWADLGAPIEEPTEPDKPAKDDDKA